MKGLRHVAKLRQVIGGGSHDPEAAIRRRVRRADEWWYRLDGILRALRLPRSRWLPHAPYLAGLLVSDLVEMVRGLGPVGHLGHAYLDAIATPMRIEQDPRYRSYWYDPAIHAAVGLHLGLDLNRYRGRFHLIESNLCPAMRPERRRLYETELDPVLVGIARTAKEGGFERAVLIRPSWSDAQYAEFARVAQVEQVDFVGATTVPMSGRANSGGPLMASLPVPLQPRTLYVVFSPANWLTPLVHFVHNKACVAQWMSTALADAPDAPGRLASVPSFDRLVVPEAAGERWPNLVVKLADFDKAAAVVMGRFTSEAQACEALRLANKPGAVPGVLTKNWRHRLMAVAFRDRLKAIYQPFIPPEVMDGRARLIRMHVLLSPVASRFLSAHGVLAGERLPDRLAPGIITDARPFVVNFSGGCEYCLLEPELEAELEDVAFEFARVASRAIEQRFMVAPAGCGSVWSATPTVRPKSVAA